MASQRRKILIIPENNPSVIIFIGRNNILSTGLTSEYRIVRTILAIIKVAKLVKPTVGNAQARTPNVKAVISIARNILLCSIANCETLLKHCC